MVVSVTSSNAILVFRKRSSSTRSWLTNGPACDLEIFTFVHPSTRIFRTAFRNQCAGQLSFVELCEIVGVLEDDRRSRSAIPGPLGKAEARRKTDVQDFYHAMHLALLIHQKKITHFHAHFATSATTAARWAARIAGIRYSVTMHANDIFHESVDPADLVAKIDDSKFVVTVSEYNRQYLAKRFDCTDKIHRIYNGLDLKKFGYKSPVSRPRRIVAVGRLVHKKGFADLIDACRLLADQAIDFSCDIIGGGELERALGDRIAQLQLHDRVRLTGPLPQNDVRRIIGQSAMLVAPCVVADDGNRDGLPTVITEALALGTPCISTAVTGIPEIVRDQETGIIVSQNSPHELASAMIRLLDNERLGISLATSARQLVEREFDLHNNVARIRELFLDSAIKSPHFSTANQVV